MANNTTKATAVSGYVIDFVNNALVINHKFARAAKAYGSPEYKRMVEIKKDFPDIKIIERSGREAKTPHHSKRLKYTNMKQYIQVQDNADELMAAFNIAVEESKKEKSPYAFVRRWFLTQFPDCHKAKFFQSDNIAELPQNVQKEKGASA